MLKEDAPDRLYSAAMRFKELQRHTHNHNVPLRREMILFHCILESENMDGTDGLRLSDLARKLEVRPPTVTQMVAELEQRGLIERTADPDDRRSVRVHLTEHGRELAAEKMHKMRLTLNGLADFLGDEKTEQLIELLRLTYDYLKNACPAYDSTNSKGSEPCSNSTGSSL